MSKAPLLGTPKQINGDASESSTSFTMFGRFALPEKLVLAVISIGVIIGGFGQSVSLPLYLSTFGDLVGAYFVLWFCSFFFTIFFAMVAVPLYWKKAITPEMTDKKWIRYMVLVGLFDSLNGFTAVYSAFLGRVPGALTTVLMQFTLPLTIIWSKIIIRKVYTRYQYLGALFVMLGIGVSLVPVFLTFSNKENFHSQTWWWPFITILSTFFGALMNVVQELMQKRFREETGQNFSVFYYQAVESFFQWAFMTALCWVDIIPGFGLNHTFAETWKSFDFDWTCFLGFSSAIHTDARCLYAGGMGLLFITCYIISYIFGTAMTLHGSANLSAIVGAISPIMTVVFWVSFPKVNAWGGGSPYTTLAIWCNVGALVPIIVGIILYQFRVQETDTHGADASSPNFSGKKNKELCW